MSENWDAVSYLVSSERRYFVLKEFEDNVRSPAHVRDNTEYNISVASRAARQLVDKGFLEDLTPQRNKGHLYKITEKGLEALQLVEEENLL